MLFVFRAVTLFQSTPSARRATYRYLRMANEHTHFNPRPPRGGRRANDIELELLRRFQSTPSARRATKHQLSKSSGRHISIHALREEGDNIWAEDDTTSTYFNPRPPRGGRPGIKRHGLTTEYFNPRPPRGGRHQYKRLFGFQNRNFNPRPPRGGRRRLRSARPARS